jgi:hypothetical protein
MVLWSSSRYILVGMGMHWLEYEIEIAGTAKLIWFQLTYCDDVVSLMRRPSLTPRKISGTKFC